MCTEFEMILCKKLSAYLRRSEDKALDISYPRLGSKNNKKYTEKNAPVLMMHGESREGNFCTKLCSQHSTQCHSIAGDDIGLSDRPKLIPLPTLWLDHHPAVRVCLQ